MPHALLIDDDAELRTLVADYLRNYGMQVTAVADAASLRAELAAGIFDVLLLDLMLPDADGLDLCRWVRERHGLPIIMLTAQGDPASRVIGLELGADDYLPKPFEPRELVARIHAVLRRTGAGRPPPSTRQPPAGTVQRFEGWMFDRLRHTLVSPDLVVVNLSNAEARLLTAFVEHPRRVLSRERLIDLARTPGSAATMRSVDLAVSRLRQKLGDPASSMSLIRTVRGEGYLFEGDVE